jgi:lauroyl/myristoyl acyltransferase
MSGVTSVAGRAVNSLRRVAPSSSLPALVRVRARRAGRRPALWADAQTQMRFVVGDDQPDEMIDRLASAYVKRMVWRGESRWHPKLVTRQQIVGLEHLRTLQRAGTGFIVNFVHHGDYEGLSPSLAWAGIPTHALATSEMFAKDQPAWLRQQARVITFNEGVTLLDVALGSTGIREVLDSGGAVAIATDVPGRTPIRFLGHDVHLASGSARIALDAKVPVAVVTAHPNPADPDGCAVLEVDEPLRPDNFESVEDLLEVMVRRHEEAFMAWPEAAEYPLRRLTDPSVK